MGGFVMRRSVLLTVISLGAVVSLLGLSGVMAVFTDRAVTGDNSISSGQVAKAADLQLASTVNGAACGTFNDDLTGPLNTLTAAQPGSKSFEGICVKNAGSSEVSLSLSAADLTDVEVACTNDESAAGDATCGTGAGELAQQLSTYWYTADCATGAVTGGLNYIAQLNNLPAATDLGTVAAGATSCFKLEVFYGLNRSVTSVQVAQSDQVTWKWAFDAATAS